MKKMIEELQGQKATLNHSVVTESLKEELIYLRNENLTKIQITKTITENQHFHLHCQHKAHQILNNHNARLEMTQN